MSSAQLYDAIGGTYPATRRTEPRIAAQVWDALGDARTVLNVGAGTGSYEPPGRDVTAVEPSAVMRAQRPEGAAPCVAATAESLPFEDQSFDAAMAFAPSITGRTRSRGCARCGAWLAAWWCSPTTPVTPIGSGSIATTCRSSPASAARPSLTELADAIGARTEPVLVPWDCADGFYEAYWRRPEAYLDEHVRRGMSIWTRVGPDAEQRAVRSLRDDLASGRWAERNRDLAGLDAAELGLRLLVA